MKKIDKSAELLWAFGIIFVALGVAICNKADLGVSMIAAPAFVISEAILPFFKFFNVGVTEYAIQGVLLLILIAIVRRFNLRYILGFSVAVIYGYVLNLFLFLLGDIQIDLVWVRWVLLLVGDCVTAFGVACFFRTYMPLQVYELFVSEIAKRFNFGIPKVKFVFDMSLLFFSLVCSFSLFGDVNTFDWSTISYSSFHSIGLGTIITTIINSPLISFMGKMIDKVFVSTPRFPKLKTFFEKY